MAISEKNIPFSDPYVSPVGIPWYSIVSGTVAPSPQVTVLGAFMALPTSIAFSGFRHYRRQSREPRALRRAQDP